MPPSFNLNFLRGAPYKVIKHPPPEETENKWSPLPKNKQAKQKMLKLTVLLEWQIISMAIFEEKSFKLWSTFFFAIQQNPGRKMINLLICDNLFPPLRQSHENS